MNAKRATRIRQAGRTRLEEVIPLKTPFHLFVDPSSACNFRCKFCFHGTNEHMDKRVMSFELFTKIIDDIQLFPDQLKVLRLYKDGEPLINKNLPRMIEYAKNKGVAEQIDFTTNGSLLTPELSLQLVQAGLDAMIISVPGINENSIEAATGVRINFDQYIENIRYLYQHKEGCRIHIKATDIGVPSEDQERYYDLFESICDEISLESIVPIWPDIDISHVKENFDQGIYNQEIGHMQVCPYIFYSLSINADGSVSSCFVDWQHKNILGNVKQETIFDIWNGEALKHLRVDHLTMNKSKYDICKNCNQLQYATIDNIDSYAGELLEKIL